MITYTTPNTSILNRDIEELDIAAWYNQPTPLTQAEIDLLSLRYNDGLNVSRIARRLGRSRQSVLRTIDRIWCKSDLPRIVIDGRPMSINIQDFTALLDAMYAQAHVTDLVPSRREIMRRTSLPGDYIDGMLWLLTEANCVEYRGPRRRYALLYATKAACLMRLGIY